MTAQLATILATTTQGSVSIGGINLDRANVWACQNKEDLWASPPVRGENTVILGLAGRLARPIVEDERDVSLPMIFGGFYRYDTGAPVGAADRFKQLGINLDYFESQLVALPGTADETRTATFTKPSGTVLSGPVQVIRPWQPTWLEAPFARAILTIRIPSGRLS